jgi:hypothetical protein
MGSWCEGGVQTREVEVQQPGGICHKTYISIADHFLAQLQCIQRVITFYHISKLPA